jgi:predicted RNase H-like nuclease (RuvC/YqgF family)
MVDYSDNISSNYVKEMEKQIIELNKTVIALKAENSALEEEIEAQKKVPVPKSIIKQIIELEALNRKLSDDLDYYKKYVPVQIIINKEHKEKPTRKGGIPK